MIISPSLQDIALERGQDIDQEEDLSEDLNEKDPNDQDLNDQDIEVLKFT